MSSKSKDVKLEQRRVLEKKLDLRLQQLAQKGIGKEKADSDPLVKKLKAKIRETNLRIKTADKFAQKTQELAQAKAQKLAQESQKTEELKSVSESSEPKSKKKSTEGAKEVKPKKKAESSADGEPKKPRKKKEEPQA